MHIGNYGKQAMFFTLGDKGRPLMFRRDDISAMSYANLSIPDREHDDRNRPTVEATAKVRLDIADLPAKSDPRIVKAVDEFTTMVRRSLGMTKHSEPLQVEGMDNVRKSLNQIKGDLEDISDAFSVPDQSVAQVDVNKIAALRGIIPVAKGQHASVRQPGAAIRVMNEITKGLEKNVTSKNVEARLFTDYKQSWAESAGVTLSVADIVNPRAVPKDMPPVQIKVFIIP